MREHSGVAPAWTDKVSRATGVEGEEAHWPEEQGGLPAGGEWEWEVESRTSCHMSPG